MTSDSSASIFSSLVKHLLFNFPASSFLLLTDTMLETSSRCSYNIRMNKINILCFFCARVLKDEAVPSSLCICYILAATK